MKTGSRMTIQEIMDRLQVGRDMVYAMLRSGQLPGTRMPGRSRWIVTRQAFEEWERANGLRQAGSDRAMEASPR